MKALKYSGLALLAILILGLALPYVRIDAYRERIQNSLESALDRKVRVGKVRLNLFTGPGFTLEDVTIFDDPSIGIEPIAYVETLNARLRLTSIFSRTPSFSNLRLNNPTVNLSKSDSGVWNFQLLGRTAPAAASRPGQFPSIQVRSGRINFKFGDYKTIFYLSDSDVDVTPLEAERLDVRFSGQPARTDQAAQSFGRLLARGTWKRPPSGMGELDVNAELEPSSIPDLVRLVEGHGVGLHGKVGTRARITGPVNNLTVVGQLRLDDIHRWDLLPAKPGGWDVPYRGTADLVSQRIQLDTEQRQDVPLMLRFGAHDYLSDPKFALNLDVKEAPVSGFLDLARHIGMPIPPGLTADGKVAGVVGFARPGGMQGQLLVHDSYLKFEKTGGLELRRAEFVVNGDDVQILPSTVGVADGQSAEVQGRYDTASGAFNLAISTDAMNVAALHTGSESLFGGAGVLFLDQCRQGTVRGSLAYSRKPDEPAEWSGQFELQNARLQVDGLDGALRVNDAQVQLDGPKLVVTNVRGRAGAVNFRGEFARDPARRPDRMKIDIDSTTLPALESALMPALRRDAGWLARFRLRRVAPPDWLRSRHVTANVRINKLMVGETEWAIDHVRAVWEGASVKLMGLAARNGDAEASGQVNIDLTGPAPRYHATGKIESLEFRGGTLDLDGTLDAAGTGSLALNSAQGSGTFTAEDVTLAPDVDFRSMNGTFELAPTAKLKIVVAQATQGSDSYSGQGATQADGRILLELTGGKRQVLRVAVAR